MNEEEILQAIRKTGCAMRRANAACTHGDASAPAAEPAALNLFTVIGTDQRRPVQQIWKYPFRAVVRIRAHNSAGIKAGSGFLVGPSTVLTAAHCLHDMDLATPAASAVEVVTANGTALQVGGWDTLSRWRNTGDSAADLGCIRLVGAPGAELGYLGTRTITQSETAGDFAVAGYPLDRGGHKVLYCDIGANPTIAGAFLDHPIDTEEGQSGSPLFYISDNQAIAVGVHIRGDDAGNGSNRALRLTAPLIERVRNWLK